MSYPYSTEELHAASRLRFDIFMERAYNVLNPGTPLLWNWHLEALSFKLQQVAEGKIRRLIINIPPRSLKSVCASIAFPAWLLGCNPAKRIICVSYSQDLARMFSLQTRQLMKSEMYKDVFPNTVISEEKDTESFFRTTQHGQLLATSVGGTLTGQGGDILILDDPLKAEDARSDTKRTAVNDWYRSTALSRLDDPKSGAIIVVMQRLHLDDLTAFLLEQQGWEVLRLPAIADITRTYELYDGAIRTFEAGELLHRDRLGEKELKELKASLGTAQFEAQYLQSPVPGGGNVFHWDWFKYLDEASALGEYEYVVQSWDIATTQSATSNYSACTTWGITGDRSVLIDVHRVKLEFVPLIREVERLDEKFQPDVIVIETSGVGINVYQQARATIGDYVLSVSPAKGKLERAEGVTPLIEAGNVLLPPHAPWLVALREEVRAFPAGKHDDQVDSMVQFLANRPRLIERAHVHRRPVRSSNGTTAYVPALNLDLSTITDGGRKEFLQRHDPIFRALFE
jgi:predicted phage terminase large subunit-like protein